PMAAPEAIIQMKRVAVTSKIDGTVLSVDKENALAVVANKTVDAFDIEETTVKVYDLITGEVIREDSVKSPYNRTSNEEGETIGVAIHYPVIRVEKTKYVKQGEGETTKPEKEVSYYIAEKDGELVYTTSDTSFEVYEYQNGLVCFLMGDKYVWIDRDMNVIRSVETIVANYNYAINPDLFQSEYKGYLYSFDSMGLMVFNHSGVVSAKYTVSSKDAYINSFVLDDGNVLVQEFTDVGAYGSCDFVLSGTRYTMKSMIVNAVNGTVTDIELDCVVDYVLTEYEQEDILSGMYLANGRDNFAIVYKVANGSISAYASICVMDNAGKIVYTVKNDTFGVDFSYGIEYIGRERYLACMNTNGSLWQAIFDLDGSFISAYNVSDSSMTDKYIVSNNAIYSYDMDLVYDFANDGYALVDVMGNNIYLKKVNYETGNVEIYRYAVAGKTELVIEDFELEMVDADDEVYILYDDADEVYRVYNTAGEEILVSCEEVLIYDVNDGVKLLITQFEGEAIIYVVK
ncbi:MAG: hypothetical protein IKJ24_04280, partial [Clostridia bacterium]|nr:hypothetical protein [Clostridia bacterium]